MTFADISAPFRDAGLRGSLVVNAPLASLTWFRTGGPAQLLEQYTRRYCMDE